MSAARATLAALLALACLPAAEAQQAAGSMLLLPQGQGGFRAPASAPAWRLEPQEGRSPAWLLALWGHEPYAEILAGGLPLPPTAAEVEALPATVRLRHQSALKAALLHSALRARSERHRVTRENLALTAGVARSKGAPPAFVTYLLHRASDVSSHSRYLAEMAEERLLAAYGVDARAIRYFAEGSGLTPAQLKELQEWLPLPALFDLMPLEPAVPTASSLRADYVAETAVRYELALLARSIHDRASADAAAEAMLPLLLRHLSARTGLALAPPALVSSALAPLAPYAAPMEKAWHQERARLVEQGFFGSPRLQALDYLLH